MRGRHTAEWVGLLVFTLLDWSTFVLLTGRPCRLSKYSRHFCSVIFSSTIWAWVISCRTTRTVGRVSVCRTGARRKMDITDLHVVRQTQRLSLLLQPPEQRLHRLLQSRRMFCCASLAKPTSSFNVSLHTLKNHLLLLFTSTVKLVHVQGLKSQQRCPDITLPTQNGAELVG